MLLGGVSVLKCASAYLVSSSPHLLNLNIYPPLPPYRQHTFTFSDVTSLSCIASAVVSIAIMLEYHILNGSFKKLCFSIRMLSFLHKQSHEGIHQRLMMLS